MSRHRSPQPVPAHLVQLTSHRWNVPVLASLHPDRSLRFGDLLNALPVCKDSLSRSLGALRSPRWVQRGAPRYGPYRLTDSGRRLAAPCSRLLALSTRGDLPGDVVLRKWTLPIAAALAGWTLRFSEIRVLVPDVTSRALTLTLKEMVAAGLVERQVLGGFPPSTSYRLTAAGRRIGPSVQALERAVPGG